MSPELLRQTCYEKGVFDNMAGPERSLYLPCWIPPTRRWSRPQVSRLWLDGAVTVYLNHLIILKQIKSRLSAYSDSFGLGA